MSAPGFSPLALVLNTSAGLAAAGDKFNRIETALPGAHVERVHTGLDTAGVARRAIEAGARTVVAAGGDGTVRAVAQAVADAGAVLGIIPGGTLNHLARELKIPLGIEAAAEVVRQRHIRRIDAGDVNGLVFVNNAVLGMYAAYRLERAGQERRGAPRAIATAGAALRVFARNPLLRLQMRFDGRQLLRYSPLVLIANNEHKMRAYELGTRERLDTGRLYIYVMRPGTRAGLFRTALRVISGRLERHEAFEIFAASEAVIETGRSRIRLSLDGELVELDAPLHFRSRPRALRVIVPANGAERRPASAL